MKRSISFVNLRYQTWTKLNNEGNLRINIHSGSIIKLNKLLKQYDEVTMWGISFFGSRQVIFKAKLRFPELVKDSPICPYWKNTKNYHNHLDICCFLCSYQQEFKNSFHTISDTYLIQAIDWANFACGDLIRVPEIRIRQRRGSYYYWPCVGSSSTFTTDLI